MSRKRWWRSPPVTDPGSLGRNLSRLARHHGAIFAIPANDKPVPVREIVQSRNQQLSK
jgi:hypothetical protein